MTMTITAKKNPGSNRDFMSAVGDDANDVFVATSEWAWMPNDYGVWSFNEMDWVIFGGGGNDHLTAGDEDDMVSGGSGNDTLFGLDGSDNLFGDDGNDQIYGGAMADTISGGAGNDWLVGGDGDDLIYGESREGGGSGADTLIGGPGADTMRGGDGDDTYYVDNAGDVVQERGWDLNGYGTYSADSKGHDTVMVGIPSYTLPDLIEVGRVQPGYNLATKIVGNDWANQLFGGSAADTLEGGAGNDTLDGYGNNDVMKGGTGDDTYVVTESGDQVIELPGEGTDLVQVHLASYLMPAHVENAQIFAAGAANLNGNASDNKIIGNLYANQITGGDGNDTIDGLLGDDTLAGGTGDDSLEGNFGNDLLFGADGNDVLSGSFGNDQLFGGVGNDTLRGGNDSDTLYGEAGSDQLFGDSGNDVLVGGAGKDYLSGGAGADTFKFNATGDSTPLAWDVILDFTRGSDKIDLSSIDANLLVPGNQAFTFNASKPFFTSPGDLWITSGRDQCSVFVDVNGDGVADMRIDVMGVSTLSAADLTL